jgi:hypothetical protein
VALVTGTPLGTITSQDEITLEGAPNIYFQDVSADPLHNPDGDSFYWGLSGTSSYPVYQLGCYIDVALGEDVTLNAVRCDTVGDKSSVQKRNYIELTLTLQHLFPLAVLRHVMNASAVTSGSGVEKMGIGKINNNQFWMVYLPKVYDDDTGDYVLFHLHRAQFVDAWSINMTSGEPWAMSGVRIRGYADEDLPSAQQFATVIRADVSAI